MIIYTLLSITVLFFIFVLIKDSIYKITKINICAICAAVSITWISLIIMKLLGYIIDNVIIAILMGQSIVGIMYYLDKKMKNKLMSSLSKLFTIVFGTLIVYYLIKVI
ncbi:MAG TPA: hypothetical protein VJH20_00035 [Candidatus Nanoarchaeia archaeon]|nr:hypothetical protein [Candidatus Nanoarchaeia archaeon]